MVTYFMCLLFAVCCYFIKVKFLKRNEKSNKIVGAAFWFYFHWLFPFLSFFSCVILFAIPFFISSDASGFLFFGGLLSLLFCSCVMLSYEVRQITITLPQLLCLIFFVYTLLSRWVYHGASIHLLLYSIDVAHIGSFHYVWWLIRFQLFKVTLAHVNCCLFLFSYHTLQVNAGW